MQADGEKRGADDTPEPIRGGSLSALVRELARATAPQPGTDRGPPLAPGTLVGRFELVREMLRPLPAGPAPDERLLREAETAARLAHPNIVTLYDAGRSERGPYLVLELLRGETLGSRLAAGPLPARESLRIASEIAKGLAHAHERGVAHRDLKPANVFPTRSATRSRASRGCA